MLSTLNSRIGTAVTTRRHMEANLTDIVICGHYLMQHLPYQSTDFERDPGLPYGCKENTFRLRGPGILVEITCPKNAVFAAFPSQLVWYIAKREILYRETD
ncbi:hypothetical protein QQ045_023067 [Rhodiola kirilowii]